MQIGLDVLIEIGHGVFVEGNQAQMEKTNANDLPH